MTKAQRVRYELTKGREAQKTQEKMQREIDQLRQDTSRLVSPSKIKSSPIIQKGSGRKSRPKMSAMPDGVNSFDDSSPRGSKSPRVKDAAAKSAARRAN